MKQTITANQLKGRAIGSIFFTGFGAAWILLSLYIREILRVDLAILVGAVAAALLLCAVWLMQEAKRYPNMPEDPARGRAFTRINAIQWAAVGFVAFTFARLHMDAYVLSAITAIVGVHFFPLAKLFRYPMHNVTGAVLVIWASVSVLLIPAEHLQGITALGTGIILWSSAAITLGIALTMVRRVTPASAQGRLCV
jgi:hypothetical protein